MADPYALGMSPLDRKCKVFPPEAATVVEEVDARAGELLPIRGACWRSELMSEFIRSRDLYLMESVVCVCVRA